VFFTKEAKRVFSRVKKQKDHACSGGAAAVRQDNHCCHAGFFPTGPCTNSDHEMKKILKTTWCVGRCKVICGRKKGTKKCPRARLSPYIVSIDLTKYHVRRRRIVNYHRSLLFHMSSFDVGLSFPFDSSCTPRPKARASNLARSLFLWRARLILSFSGCGCYLGRCPCHDECLVVVR
jgi:hypothetical protein